VASGANELRALLPLWLPCVFVIAAGGALTGPRFSGLAMAGFAFGSFTIGAHAIGHEYTHGTLGALLAQPVERRSVLLVKLGILTALLAILAATAQATTGGAGSLVLSPAAVSLLVLLCALFVAPALTMLGRSSIAGVVFTVALVGLIVGAAEIVSGLRFAGPDPAADGFRGLFIWWVTLAVCAVCATASWQLFTRLQALDGRGNDIMLPAWRVADDATTSPRRRPLWCLAAKEVHLQQMVFVVAALFVCAMLAISLVEAMEPGRGLALVPPAAALYTCCVPLVAGSMASAEERQLGTAQWQLLLPVSASRQWLVKSGMALALSLGLTLALPTAADWLLSVRPDWVWPGGLRLNTLRSPVLIVVLLTSISLYVSSLSRSGIRALLVAVSAAGSTAMVIAAVESVSRWTLIGLWLEWMPFVRKFWPVAPRTMDPSRHFIEPLLVPLAVGAVSSLLWWFASVNHKTGEMPAVLVRRQLGWIEALVTCALGFTLLMRGYVEAAFQYDFLKMSEFFKTLAR